MNAETLTPEATEARMREILGDGWRAPRADHDRLNFAALRDAGDVPWIAQVGPFWQFAGTHPALRGECIASADADGIVLAERLAGLVAKSKESVNVSRETLSQAPEPEYAPEHETAVEDAGFTDAQWRQLDPGFDPNCPEPQTLGELDDSPLLTFEAEMAEAEAQAESPQDRFYGLDDLDRRRNLRIGDVSVKAVMLAPEVDTVRLAELRNFVMGVTEGRWPDDADKRDELDTLEATLRLAHAIGAARDAKIAYLLAADRDGVEAFDLEADWP